MRLFDLHAHVLPGVDDGAATMDQALRMLRNAVASNVAAVAITPHCNVPDAFENYQSTALVKRFEELQQAARDLPIRLVLGAEVHVTDRLPELLDQQLLPTINNSRYLLLEFPFRCDPEAFNPELDSVLEAGYVPLIAHPERYRAVCDDPRIVTEWLDKGCHLQITRAGMMGKFGSAIQKTADILLKNDCVCCVASDAHNTTHRSNYLVDAYESLCLYYGKRYADILMWENPTRICNDEDL